MPRHKHMDIHTVQVAGHNVDLQEQSRVHVEARHWAEFYGLSAAALFVLGAIMQDWGHSFHGFPMLTLFPGWGTYMMYYVLFAQGVSYALFHLSPMQGRLLDRLNHVAFWLYAVSMLFQGISVQFFAADGEFMATVLFVLHKVTFISSSFLLAAVCVIAGKNSGHFDGAPKDRRVVFLFAAAAAVLSVFEVVFMFQRMHLASFWLAIGTHLVGAAMLVAIALMTHELLAAFLLFVTFFGAFLINQLEPWPYAFSPIWGYQALTLNILMLYIVAVFFLITRLDSHQTAWNKVEHFAHAATHKPSEAKVMLERSSRRCCDDWGFA